MAVMCRGVEAEGALMEAQSASVLQIQLLLKTAARAAQVCFLVVAAAAVAQILLVLTTTSLRLNVVGRAAPQSVVGAALACLALQRTPLRAYEEPHCSTSHLLGPTTPWAPPGV